MISLAPVWADGLPETVFVSPDAPFACDMVPPGYPDSYQWFSLQSRDPHAMLTGAQRAAPILQEFIEAQQVRLGVPASRTALVGFSQGTMMSLYAAPRMGEALAGVVGYSGALIGEGDLSAPSMHKSPVLLIHGEVDDVVPVSAYHHARAALEKNGFSVTGGTTPNLPHSIDQQGLESGLKFLKSVLG